MTPTIRVEDTLALAFQDLILYGSMHLIRHADGTLERTPPQEWSRESE